MEELRRCVGIVVVRCVVVVVVVIVVVVVVVIVILFVIQNFRLRMRSKVLEFD